MRRKKIRNLGLPEGATGPVARLTQSTRLKRDSSLRSRTSQKTGRKTWDPATAFRMTTLRERWLFLGGVLVGGVGAGAVVCAAVALGAGTGEGEAEQQKGDESEDGEEEEDDHRAADAVPKAEPGLLVGGGGVGEEIEIEIERDEEREESDDGAGDAGDGADYALGEFVVDEHLLQG